MLDGADCAALGHQLADAIRLGWTVRGAAPPHALLELADRVNAAVRAAETGTGSGDVRAGRGRGPEHRQFRVSPAASSCDQPVKLGTKLGTKEAAQAAEVSDGYMRRLCRQGVLGTRDEARGSWSIDSRELAAWDSRRREERERKAA